MIQSYFLKRNNAILFLLIGILYALIVASPLSAQNKQALNPFTVKGTVMSSPDNEPLPGVNVYIKGAAQGTVTDIHGKYSIQVKFGNILVFSFVGYDKQEITITNEKILNVVLKPQAQMLNQMVVIGYGSLKKSEVSGAISKINNVNLSEIPVANAGKALIGKIPGLQIQNIDAQAGQAPNIIVRGVSTINTSSSPLIIVDGYPVPDDLSSIDMSNVASVTVLKDAASAAIYGSRASNGVIIITTKQGKAGKTTFNFNAFTGVNQPYPHKPVWDTPQQWANFVYADTAVSHLPVDKRIPAMLSLGTATDWESLELRNGLMQNYNINASGGNKKVNFFIGVGYENDEGIIITNNYKKYHLDAKISAKINKWLTMGVNFKGSYSKQRIAAVGFHDAIRTGPWLPLRLTDSTVGYARAAGYDVSVGDYAAERYFTNVNGVSLKTSSDNNGYVKLEGRYRNYFRYRTSARIYAKVKFSKNFRFKTTLGAYYKNYNYEYYQSAWSYRKGIASGYLHNYQTLNWLNQNTLTYHKKWKKNDITGLAGLTFQSDQVKTAYIVKNTFLTDNIHTLNGGTNIDAAYTLISQSTLASTFFRINYAYDSKYILALSNRWDGSSRFGANNKWGAFPSVSAAWRISQENFLKNNKWISELKLRGSFGTTGNNNIGDYSSLAMVDPGFNAVFGIVDQGFSTTSLANPSLQWEKTYQFDAGIDFGILEGRIVLSADYYNSKTHNLLLKKQIPSVTGFTSVWSNMGKVQNKGFEFDITSHNIVKSKFKWVITSNFYTNKNKLLSLGGPTQLISTPDSKRPSQFIAQVGGPIDQFYGYVVDHTKGDDGQVPRQYLKTPYWPIDIKAGFVYVKDMNHDGVITPADRVPLGSPYPKFTWGITNDFTIGRFNLSFMFAGSHGAKVYNIDNYYYHFLWKGTYLSTTPDQQFLKSKVVTDWNIQNASYIALKTLMCGYNLPEQVVSKMHLSSFRVYLTIYNLAYFMAKGYTGLNPEGVNKYKTILTYGYQRGVIPIQRSFNLGVNIKF